jgi:hypothetical protein
MQDDFNKETDLARVVTRKVYADKGLAAPFAESSGKNKQISELHKRSFADSEISGHAIWEDEFGNIFMAMNVKGQPPENKWPYVEEDQYSKKGLRVHYLCDSTDVEKTNIVSEIMRQNGLNTERITEKSEIEQIEISGEYIPIGKLKEYLLQNRFSSDKFTEDDIRKYLEGTDFYIVKREMPIDERIEDMNQANAELSNYVARYESGEIVYKGKYFKNLDEYKKHIYGIEDADGKRVLKKIEGKPNRTEIADSGDRLKEILGSAFKYLKMAEGIELDIENEDDIRKFISDILPQRMGEYLGEFHQLGLKHTYPGSKNWLLIAKLVDLDSVHGPGIDGKITTDSDIQTDLQQSILAIQYIYDPVYKYVDFMFENEEGKKVPDRLTYRGFIASLWDNDEEKVSEVSHLAVRKMLDSYKVKRGLSEEYLAEHVDPGIFIVSDHRE